METPEVSEVALFTFKVYEVRPDCIDKIWMQILFNWVLPGCLACLFVVPITFPGLLVDVHRPIRI